MTLRGNNPVNCRVFLDSRPIEWTSKVKYLGIHILAGAVQKVDVTDAKRKYYGCLKIKCNVFLYGEVNFSPSVFNINKSI